MTETPDQAELLANTENQPPPQPPREPAETADQAETEANTEPPTSQ